MGDSVAREAEREAFYANTEAAFHRRLADLIKGVDPAEVALGWLVDLRAVVMARFQALALPGLDQRETDVIQRIVQAQGWLVGGFKGYGKYGGEMFKALNMALPAKKGKAA